MENTNGTVTSKKRANIGDVILFSRNEDKFEGTVFTVRENSVLVEISKDAARLLGYEMPNTVVRHENYIIKKKK